MNYKTSLPLLLCFCFCLSNSLYAQSKFEYGIGFGIHIGDYSEDIDFETDLKIPEVDKSRILPSVNTRIAYLVNERWKVSLNPTIAMKGANEVFGTQTYTSYNFDFPLLAHFNITKNFHFYAGPQYSYVSLFTVEQDGITNVVTDNFIKRHLYAGVVGFGLDLGKYLELNLSFNGDIDEAIAFRYTDDFGTDVGIINLRNQYLELGIVFRK